eukprot:CAMPEP_0119129616 /NCGR_PEP_ID=MMETSP1310-20130426/7288_1 /TAXON_ID=464262 /ORGANISM="Genus nov. species nov., Strain RCC2339" /LENGTH=1565 /DNA_ID=CAMNT_0007120049 /DNA_START=89 /DNA_END=4786 /DNA_ORIENTATION=-
MLWDEDEESGELGGMKVEGGEKEKEKESESERKKREEEERVESLDYKGVLLHLKVALAANAALNCVHRPKGTVENAMTSVELLTELNLLPSSEVVALTISERVVGSSHSSGLQELALMFLYRLWHRETCSSSPTSTSTSTSTTTSSLSEILSSTCKRLLFSGSYCDIDFGDDDLTTVPHLEKRAIDCVISVTLTAENPSEEIGTLLSRCLTSLEFYYLEEGESAEASLGVAQNIVFTSIRQFPTHPAVERVFEFCKLALLCRPSSSLLQSLLSICDSVLSVSESELVKEKRVREFWEVIHRIITSTTNYFLPMNVLCTLHSHWFPQEFKSDNFDIAKYPVFWEIIQRDFLSKTYGARKRSLFLLRQIVSTRLPPKQRDAQGEIVYYAPWDDSPEPVFCIPSDPTKYQETRRMWKNVLHLFDVIEADSAHLFRETWLKVFHTSPRSTIPHGTWISIIIMLAFACGSKSMRSDMLEAFLSGQVSTVVPLNFMYVDLPRYLQFEGEGHLGIGTLPAFFRVLKFLVDYADDLPRHQAQVMIGGLLSHITNKPGQRRILTLLMRFFAEISPRRLFGPTELVCLARTFHFKMDTCFPRFSVDTWYTLATAIGNQSSGEAIFEEDWRTVLNTFPKHLFWNFSPEIAKRGVCYGSEEEKKVVELNKRKVEIYAILREWCSAQRIQQGNATVSAGEMIAGHTEMIAEGLRKGGVGADMEWLEGKSYWASVMMIHFLNEEERRLALTPLLHDTVVAQIEWQGAVIILSLLHRSWDDIRAAGPAPLSEVEWRLLRCVVLALPDVLAGKLPLGASMVDGLVQAAWLLASAPAMDGKELLPALRRAHTSCRSAELADGVCWLASCWATALAIALRLRGDVVRVEDDLGRFAGVPPPRAGAALAVAVFWWLGVRQEKTLGAADVVVAVGKAAKGMDALDLSRTVRVVVEALDMARGPLDMQSRRADVVTALREIGERVNGGMNQTIFLKSCFYPLLFHPHVLSLHPLVPDSEMDALVWGHMKSAKENISPLNSFMTALATGLRDCPAALPRFANIIVDLCTTPLTKKWEVVYPLVGRREEDAEDWMLAVCSGRRALFRMCVALDPAVEAAALGASSLLNVVLSRWSPRLRAPKDGIEKPFTPHHIERVQFSVLAVVLVVHANEEQAKELVDVSLKMLRLVNQADVRALGEMVCMLAMRRQSEEGKKATVETIMEGMTSSEERMVYITSLIIIAGLCMEGGALNRDDSARLAWLVLPWVSSTQIIARRYAAKVMREAANMGLGKELGAAAMRVVEWVSQNGHMVPVDIVAPVRPMWTRRFTLQLTFSLALNPVDRYPVVEEVEGEAATEQSRFIERTDFIHTASAPWEFSASRWAATSEVPQEEGGSEQDNMQAKIKPWSGISLDTTSDVRRELYLRSERQHLIVVASLLENIPNLGGLARTCEIFRVGKLIVPDLTYIQNPTFQSLAVSSETWVPIEEVKPSDLMAFLRHMREEHFSIVGLEQTRESVDILDFSFPKRTVLLLGKEKTGIPVQYLSALDHAVEIPQYGVTRSLNVHVSAAVCVWEFTKQNQSAIRAWSA